MRRAICLLVVPMLIVALQSAGRAATGGVEGLDDVSDGAAFPPVCSAHAFALVLPESFEYEPHVAVDPTDPSHIVISWNQGGQMGNVVAVTNDGGSTWTQVIVPGVSGCSGAELDSGAADARLAFDSGGSLYLASLTFSLIEVPGVHDPERIVVSRSADGGHSWLAPVVIDSGSSEGTNGEDSLAAHPTLPGHLYLVWTVRGGDRFTLKFSRSSDSGVTWDPPKTILDAGAGSQPFVNHLRVLPDGTLLNAFLDGTEEKVIRSTDGGDSWSAPIKVADTILTDPQDPDGAFLPTNPFTVFAIPAPSLDVGSDGRAYIAWHAIDADDSSIFVAASSDGGATWSSPLVVKHQTAQTFQPTLAVAPDGTVGVTFYDTRNDVAGDSQLTTDVWFAHSHDQGLTWSEVHVAGPFDVRSSGYSPGQGYILGDYFGLAANGHRFVAAFVGGAPIAVEPPTDIFAAFLGY